MISSNLTEALAERLPDLYRRVTAGAGVDGVKRVVSKRLGTYPQPRRSATELASFWLGYSEACSHIPETALEAAMSEWVASPDSQFLPMPGQLRDLAGRMPTPGMAFYAKAKAAVDAARDAQRRQDIDADIAARGTTKQQQAQQIRDMLSGMSPELARTADQHRRWLKGEAGAIPFANRVVVPKGPLTEAQKDVLRRCGKDVD